MEQKNRSVQKSDFKNIRYIGSGAFGEVILVKKISDEKIYAMKRLDKRFIDKVTSKASASRIWNYLGTN